MKNAITRKEGTTKTTSKRTNSTPDVIITIAMKYPMMLPFSEQNIIKWSKISKTCTKGRERSNTKKILNINFKNNSL
jgi:hypothetical protein